MSVHFPCFNLTSSSDVGSSFVILTLKRIKEYSSLTRRLSCRLNKAHTLLSFPFPHSRPQSYSPLPSARRPTILVPLSLPLGRFSSPSVFRRVPRRKEQCLERVSLRPDVKVREFNPLYKVGLIAKKRGNDCPRGRIRLIIMRMNCKMFTEF